MLQISNTTDEMFELALAWAALPRNGPYYGQARDGGSICLRVEPVVHNDLLYRAIMITSVGVPDEQRGKGKYKAFLSSLDEQTEYAVRWHAETGNPWLANWHRKNGLTERDGSFYRVNDPSKGEPRAPFELIGPARWRSAGCKSRTAKPKQAGEI